MHWVNLYLYCIRENNYLYIFSIDLLKDVFGIRRHFYEITNCSPNIHLSLDVSTVQPLNPASASCADRQRALLSADTSGSLSGVVAPLSNTSGSLSRSRPTPDSFYNSFMNKSSTKTTPSLGVSFLKKKREFHCYGFLQVLVLIFFRILVTLGLVNLDSQL